MTQQLSRKDKRLRCILGIHVGEWYGPGRDCMKHRICNLCGTTTSRAQHDWPLMPSSIQNGVLVYICKRCGKVRVQNMRPLYPPPPARR